jgi:acyl carrier protein
MIEASVARRGHSKMAGSVKPIHYNGNLRPEGGRTTGSTMTSTQIEQWMTLRIGAALGVAPDEVDVDAAFVDHGLDSVSALRMLGQLEETLDRPIEPSLLFEHPTIALLSRFLAT